MKDKGRQRIRASDLQGRAWAFPTIEAARAAYHALLRRPGFLGAQYDWSLVTCMFAGQAVLTFLWGPNVDQKMPAIVDTVALLAGGNLLEKAQEEELVGQIRLRWQALRPRGPQGGIVTKHHPHGKVWWAKEGQDDG